MLNFYDVMLELMRHVDIGAYSFDWEWRIGDVFWSVLKDSMRRAAITRWHEICEETERWGYMPLPPERFIGPPSEFFGISVVMVDGNGIELVRKSDAKA